jgi:hypothetical protein
MKMLKSALLIPGAATAKALCMFALLAVFAFGLGAQTNPVLTTNIVVYESYYGWDAVTVSGRYLYAGSAGGSGLKVFDISHPSTPVDLGYTDNSYRCYSIACAGDFVYALDPLFRVFNVSNPTSPVIVASPGGDWMRVRVAGQFAYLVFGGGSASTVYDVGNPTNPVPAGTLPWGYDVAVLDNYAYVPTGGSILAQTNGLFVCDISDKQHIKTVVAVGMTNTPVQAVIGGDYLYLNAYDKGGRYCCIFNISNRTNPIPVKVVGPGGYSIGVAGNYLYTLGGQTLDIYDVSNPTNATRIAIAALPFNSGGQWIAISQNYAYLALSESIGVYSLGAPAAPELRIASTGTNTVVLSWPTPAAAFAVQQSPSLSLASWVTVTDRSVVVAGRNQVVLPAPSGTMFYWLVSE